MAPKSILFVALCLVAGLIALVGAQSSPSCLSKMQEHAGSYRRDAQEQVQTFADRLRGHSSDAVDIEKFRRQGDRMIDNFMSLVDVREGFSLAKMTKAYTSFLESQIEMYQLFMRIDKAQDMTNEYYRLANEMSRMTTSYLMRAARDCLGGF